MKTTRDEGRTTGRKEKKARSHMTIAENLNQAAEFLGRQTFGSKTAYIEHLIMKDLEAQGITAAQVPQLAAEWRKQNDAAEGERSDRLAKARKIGKASTVDAVKNEGRKKKLSSGDAEQR